MKIASLLIVALAAAQALACSATDCDPLGVEQQNSEGCLLALGELPLETTLLPGLVRGTLDPVALTSYLGESAPSRTWSAPDPQEPGILKDYVEVAAPRIDIHAMRDHDPAGTTYGIETLTLRMPEIKLPCGLHVGSPVARFIAQLGPPTNPEAAGHGRELLYGWSKYDCEKGYWLAWNANISLFVADDLTVESVRWYYFAD